MDECAGALGRGAHEETGATMEVGLYDDDEEGAMVVADPILAAPMLDDGPGAAARIGAVEELAHNDIGRIHHARNG